MLNTILNTSPIKLKFNISDLFNLQLRSLIYLLNCRASRSSTFCFQAPSIYNIDIPISQSLGALNRATPLVQNKHCFKPWPNGLASRRKSRQVLDLRSTCVSFGHPLALTCVDLGRAQIRTQVDACFSPFGHPTQVDTT